MHFKTLALQTTYKCNANCDICVFNCDMTKDRKMELEDAYRYIDEAFEMDSFQELGISGGEPFLFYDDLVKICTKAYERKIPINISTNGFWGKTKEEAYEKMRELRSVGVHLLAISSDEFHAPYVPYESIRNIIDMSKSTGMRIEIHTVYTENSSKMSDVIKKIGNDVTHVDFVQYNCSKCGRAETKIDENEFKYYYGLPRGKCNGLNVLCIDANNTSYPCCRMTNRNSCFMFKDTNKYSIKDIIQFYKNNIYLKILEYYGTGWFIDTIKEHNLNVQLKDKYTCVCELCGDLFKDITVYDEAIDKLKQTLLKNKNNIIKK